VRGGKQPMLITKNKKSAKRFGIENTLIYLVPEFCIMTGITDAMRYFSNFIILIAFLLSLNELFLF